VKVAYLFLLLLISGTLRSEAQVPADLDTYMQQHYPPKGAGAVILIAQHGQVKAEKAYGMANLELNVPMDIDSVFRIGSITKQFTAVAILQLEEKGLLKLDDDITRYLPGYPTHGYTITIANLLSHTSGIKDLTTIPGLVRKVKPYDPEELIDLFKDQPMDFPPGTQYKYSNSGYILIGRIIEKPSAKTYANYPQT